MTRLDPWYQARTAMVDALIADLHGTEADATIEEAPLDRYIVGILHPRSVSSEDAAPVFADEVPEDESPSIEGDSDPGVSFAHLRYPSSVGMTFGVSSGTQRVSISVGATRYAPAEQQPMQPGDDDVATRGGGRHGSWAADSVRPEPIEVQVRPGVDEREVAPGLLLRWVIRDAVDEVVSITVVLVNTQERTEKGRADHLCWFRPTISAKTIDGMFVDRRPRQRLDHFDEDERSGELLYRQERHLAVGHGVAVTWDESPRVTHVETTFFPSHELPLADAEVEGVSALDMGEFAEGRGMRALSDLAGRYESWIGSQRRRAAQELAGPIAETANQHLDLAEQAAKRIRRGITLLESDEDAALAFRLMNAAMQQQRRRQEMIRSGATAPSNDVRAEWRPFQIAFVLFNLEGLSDPSSPERDLADLLWFPTGGGKTEAYLGLIAFSLTLRRIRRLGPGEDGAGVGVIMRYTLRLLTLQQFERAAGLICALEDLRTTRPELSNAAPYSIGLWVGQSATPNSVENARRALNKRRRGEDVGDLGDPVQLLKCPWCGSSLDENQYDTETDRSRLIVRCPSSSCRFSGGLPVHLIDSDVYAYRPSLIIGTVDKFAMLAWNEQSGRFFGTGGALAPDLIIQDELHLISGPLGTLVGLYETAVDHLATSLEGHRPKLVASTATIRRARDQVAAVFARESMQFPPPGLDASDSFFAVEAPRDRKGTRQYVGVMAPSTSHATLLVRTYAALLQAGAELDAPDEVKDAYWTLLGYFNSLRVLGAAYIQSIDDVRDRIGVVATRHGRPPRATEAPRELTSRVKSSEIPVELDAVSLSYPDPLAADTVLATNMISVGVDVDRLGLMAVMGQPQTTSEYIQATSRVGRRHPGLVVTLYNASRSRDLSHFEAFTTYHRALYRQVEATGATPFAPRALDRGLHGVLTILARHTVPGAAPDTAVNVPAVDGALKGLTQILVKRLHMTGAEPRAEIESELKRAAEELSHQWEAAAAEGLSRYGLWHPNNEDIRSLMVPAGSELVDNGEPLIASFPPQRTPWPTLTSLRNVDRESTLRILTLGRRKEEAPDGAQ
ncbi:helicase C-terminal domain-containing protein [Salinibacterium sp. ZJ70]|uniref:helicase C-terminal domain-containing protein n=1 Tax=Salinibacterium sp. ZJ70 TaxID=2708084 RepID=UPI00141ED208|nr:helicase C-terminal domain-containing protein [Salinibacterium sp. ZJ70]